MVTEGGYDLHALAASLDAVIETLNGPSSAPVWPVGGIASQRGRESAGLVKDQLKDYWSFKGG